MKFNYLKNPFTALLLLCATAVSAHDFEVDCIYYNILSETDKTVAVTFKGTTYSEYSNEYSGSVVIPESVTYNGTTYSVTSIGNYAFYGCTGLTSIEIPNSVTSIGGYALQGTAWYDNQPNGIVYAGKVLYKYKGTMPSNTSITIKDGTLGIAAKAFYYCSDLTSVEIPNSVTSIGNQAFYNCSSLTNVVIGNSVTSIGLEAFYNCSGLTNVVIPNSVTSIGSYAFQSCSGLTSVEFNAENCTTMYSYVFNNCTALSTVTIGENVKIIPAYAFKGCSSLTSIEIPNSVTSIGACAFDGTAWYDNQPNGIVYAGKVLYKYKGTMPSNTSITIKEGTLGIGTEAFGFCSGLTSVVIPNSVTSIGDWAFSGCFGLTSITIPNSVTSIGDNAFSDCSGLTSIEIPNNVTSIGNYAFSYCTNLKSIVIGDGVTSIGEYAFSDCSGLTSIVIGDGVTSIGGYAFYNCGSLTNVVIPNSVTFIGVGAFYSCSRLTSIEIPNSVTSIGRSAFDDTAWYNNHPDGVVYAGKVLYKYKGTMPSNTSITIKEGTLGIGIEAFGYCSGLTSVVIPNSVTSIGEYAFLFCTSLANVEIPNSVTSIGNGAFHGCYSLTSVTSLIPADELFAIEWGVFYNVDKTTCTLYVPYGAKETYAATAAWNEFVNIVELEPTEVTITINQYGSATYCSPFALDFSEVEGLKAYAATGYNKATQVVTLTRVQTAEAGVGLFLKGEPGEYTVPVIEYSNDYTLNLLVGTLEETVVNSTTGEMSNYKFTIADGDAEPMFYPFEDNTTFSAGKAYLQIPTAWLPATAQKSLNIRFDEGETTDIDEVKGESGEVKAIYDLSGRVVENPTSGIYIIDGKKLIIK